MWTRTHLTARFVCHSATLRAFSNVAATSSRIISRPIHQLNGTPLRCLYARSLLFNSKSKPFVSTFTSSSKLHANDAPTATKQVSIPKSVDNDNVSVREQRRKDWMIVKRLMSHVWPKDDWRTRGRVVLGFALLIAGKVRRYRTENQNVTEFRHISIRC